MKRVNAVSQPSSLNATWRKQRWRRLLLAGNLSALVTLLGYRLLHPPMTTSGGGMPDSKATLAMKHAVYAALPSDDQVGFTRLDTVAADGWLSLNPEPLQPLWNYQRECRTRPTPTCRTIVLQPLGTMTAAQRKLLATLRDYTAICFQLPVRIAPLLALHVPAAWQRGKVVNAGGQGLQYDADKLVFDFLAARRPADAVAYLGITMSDLWAGDEGSFVFGIGSPTHQCGVYSLCRYYPEFWGHPHQPGEELQALRRACKVLNHETGHIFSLGHCVFYRCSMNGANSLAEADTQPMDYCPVCFRKLRWNIGFNGIQRYTQLLDFYRKHGMTADAAWLQGRLARWQKIQQREAPT